MTRRIFLLLAAALSPGVRPATAPRVRAGVAVPRMRQIDIAPTIALWAGWDLPEAEGLALRGLFEDKD